MIRFFFSLVFYVVVARWVYVEIATFMPHAIPYIDAGVRIISIPPHTQWGPVIAKVKSRLQKFSTKPYIANTELIPNLPKARLREDWWLTGNVSE
jgi:hypothetical protein